MNKNSLIGLILFLGTPFIFQQFPGDIMKQEISFWLLLAGMVTWIYFVEKKTLTSIGWKGISVKTVLSGVGLGIVLFILFGFITVAIMAAGIELNQDAAQLIANQPFPVLLLIAIRAGVVEEVLYRGYTFERIYELTKSKWIAGAIPVLFFMLVHLNWGVGHLIFVFFAGALFMCAYVSKRNLAMVIIAHFTTDVFALLLIPKLLEA